MPIHPSRGGVCRGDDVGAGFDLALSRLVHVQAEEKQNSKEWVMYTMTTKVQRGEAYLDA